MVTTQIPSKNSAFKPYNKPPTIENESSVELSNAKGSSGESAIQKSEMITIDCGSYGSNLQDSIQLPSCGSPSQMNRVKLVGRPSEGEGMNVNVVESKKRNSLGNLKIGDRENDNETREKTRNLENEKNKKQVTVNAEKNGNNIAIKASSSTALLSSSSKLYPSSAKTWNQMSSLIPLSTISSDTIAQRRKEFMFEKMLFQNDMNDLNRLFIPRNFAETYFPCLKIAEGKYNKETLVFFDHENIAWDMRFEFWEFSQSYVLTGGWRAFVNQYQLRPNFVVHFYQLNQYMDRKHYGIRYTIRVPIKTIRLFGQNCHCLCFDGVNDHNSINVSDGNGNHNDNGSSSSGDCGQNKIIGQGEAEEAAKKEGTSL
ncbi:uncharacterized protein LOC122063837 [Macadamia integrifolia]|uniref:uncharacterized protein LOC122063837 n=1 Tax=Macadamia integrifolia TaxID=60698 RepID=UPI001C4F8632|nr:uncharacterized protein LOC122063837 [Macadamia integrifolia]